jgi:hypothetical protein
VAAKPPEKPWGPAELCGRAELCGAAELREPAELCGPELGALRRGGGPGRVSERGPLSPAGGGKCGRLCEGSGAELDASLSPSPATADSVSQPPMPSRQINESSSITPSRKKSSICSSDNRRMSLAPMITWKTSLTSLPISRACPARDGARARPAKDGALVWVCLECVTFISRCGIPAALDCLRTPQLQLDR